MAKVHFHLQTWLWPFKNRLCQVSVIIRRVCENIFIVFSWLFLSIVFLVFSSETAINVLNTELFFECMIHPSLIDADFYLFVFVLAKQ